MIVKAWQRREQQSVQKTADTASESAKKLKSDAVMVFLPTEIAQEINDEVVKLVANHKQSGALTVKDLDEAKRIAKASGIDASNEYLRKAQCKRNPLGTNREPTRTAFVQHLIRLGFAAYKNKPAA